MKKTYTNPTLEILNPVGEIWKPEDARMNYTSGGGSLVISSEEDEDSRQ